MGNFLCTFYILSSLKIRICLIFLGIVSGVWCAVWIIFVRDTPQEVKNISEEEKNYILESLGNTASDKDQTDQKV